MGIFFLCGVGVGALAVCGITLLFWRKNRDLMRTIAVCKKDLNRTSRILIEKNLELVDQTIAQQKLLESKDDFINIVSHQLRTPITEVKWNLDEILHDTSWTLSTAQRQSLDGLYASIEQSIRLINNLVHLVSVEQGAAHFAVIAYTPDDTVRACAELVAKQFASKHITLSTDLRCADCTINSIDSDSLQMVVRNVVENAFYYTQEGGSVQIRSSVADGTYTIVVADAGIGIPQDERQDVFMKFRRGKNAVKANTRGSGLGLYIVRRILEHHKGTIAFESTEGVGTSFILTLPQIAQSVGLAETFS